MSSKLETKLLQYEKSAPISNDAELITAIESIINSEKALPLEEQDSDLIDEAVDAILSLKRVDIEQLEECAETVTDKFLNEIKDKGNRYVGESKPKSVKFKWLIPIVAVISLLIAGTLIAYSCGYDIMRISKQAYLQFVEKVNYKQGDTDIIITNDLKEYSSLDDFVKDGDYSTLLLPYNLPEEYHIDNVYVGDYGAFKEIILFISSNDSTFEVEITTPYTDDCNFLNNNTQVIGNYDVYYTQYDDVHQGEFMNEGNYYIITSPSFEQLKIIIESMGN